VKRRAAKSAGAFVAFALFFGFAGKGGAQEVVSVLSSNSWYYREALDGFMKAFGSSVPVMNLSDKIPNVTETVVAFGAQAALQPYAYGVSLIYCIAPGARLESKNYGKPPIRVEMLPPPTVLLAKLKELQPALGKLAVFWVSDSTSDYLEKLKKSAKTIAIKIESEKLASLDELPDRLRALKSAGVDALWLPPDPILLNVHTFGVFREYSWSNAVPLYASSLGLAENGATAAVVADYSAIGRAAAMAAKQAKELGGETVVYPSTSRTNVNMTAVGNVHLVIPKKALEAVDKVISAP
jgi:hypothetical protein